MAITPSQWSHVLTIPESYAPSSATSGQTLVITEGVISQMSAGDQLTFWDNVQNGGGDVRICADSAGANQLPVEVVSLDSIEETCTIWTRKDSYDGTGSLYVFIGKAGGIQPAVTDPFGRNAVWANYYNSLHLDDMSVYDATDGTALTRTGTPSEISGKVGGALTFNGSQSYKRTSKRGASSAVITFWIKSGSTPLTFLYDDSSGVDGGVQILKLDNDRLRIRLDDSGSNVSVNDTVTAFNDNAWHHVAFRLNLSGSLDIFVDGVLEVNGSNLTGFGDISATEPLTYFADRELENEKFIGSFDEFTILNGVSSDDYIATEYANQNNPATFYGTPTIQATVGGSITADAAYTINAPTFSSSANATLPQPIADVNFTLSTPVFAASAGVTLPQPSASIAYSVNAPTFTADATIAATGTADGATITAAGKTYTLTLGTSGTDVVVSTTNYISGETSSVNSFVVTFPA